MRLIGKVLVFKDGDELIEGEQLVTVTDFNKAGEIELNVELREDDPDTGEEILRDAYVRFNLAQLMTAIAREHGSEL